MPKLTYTVAQGLVQSAGEGVVFEQLPAAASVQNKTETVTLTTPGVYTFTAGAVMTGTLPSPSTFPGALFIVRNGDAFANVLTGSAADAGLSVFKSAPQASGGKLVLSAVTGASVSLVSDGRSFWVSAGSGTLSGT